MSKALFGQKLKDREPGIPLKAAALALGVTVHSLARICRGERHKGIVPGAFRIGRRWFVPRGFVEMYAELLKWERKNTGWVMMECVY